jgi:dipeptidase E
MGKIIAIGGGEIGGLGKKSKTLFFDKEIVKLAGKAHPKVLFLPTASADADGYIENVKYHFGKKLGCDVKVVRLLKEKYSKKKLKEIIFGVDIIYVGGGNSEYMLAVWKKYGVDVLLKNAHKQGIVMSGLSAGSICWFKYGCSDSRSIGKSNKINLIRVAGLGLIPALHCPHFSRDPFRVKASKEMTKSLSIFLIALDDYTAIEVVDGQYRILKSKSNAKAYKAFWHKNKYVKVAIKVEKKFKPLSKLLPKIKKNIASMSV